MKKMLSVALAALLTVGMLASCTAMMGNPDAIENYTPEDLTDESATGIFTYERGEGDTVYLAKYESLKTHGDEVVVPATVVLDGTERRVIGISNEAFYGLSAVSKVTVAASIASIGDYAFADCVGLTEFTVEEGSVLSKIGGLAFRGCTALTKVELGDNVTSIARYAFESCVALPEIQLPATLVTIGQGAFGGCEALTAIRLPESVKTVGTLAFYNCKAVETVVLHDAIEEIGTHVFLLDDDTTLVDKIDTTNLTEGSYVSKYLAALRGEETDTETDVEADTDADVNTEGDNAVDTEANGDEN